MATNFVVNQEDERLTNINEEKQTALNDVTNQYNNMIDNSQKYYDDLINSSKQYAETQQNIQNQQTEQAINEINQNKVKQENAYLKEQKGAYADYQKEVDKYGVNAEQMAASGLSNSGYAATAEMSAYNAYQSRYATAKQSYNEAIQNYDNQITNARLQNSAALAEIAYTAQQDQLKLALEGFQYNNTLLQNMITQQQATEDRYYSRWSDMLSQINFENQQNESVRQYEQNYAEQVRQYNEQMAFEREQEAEATRQFNEQMAFKQQEAQREQANWEKEYALSKAKTTASINASNTTSNPYSGNTKENASEVSKLKSIISQQASIPLVGKSMARTILKNAYEKGTITESTFMAIAAQYEL